MAAVIERLRTAKRGLGGSRRGLEELGALVLVAQRDERVLDVFERAHDAVLHAQQRLGLVRLRQSRSSPACGPS